MVHFLDGAFLNVSDVRQIYACQRNTNENSYAKSLPLFVLLCLHSVALHFLGILKSCKKNSTVGTLLGTGD